MLYLSSAGQLDGELRGAEDMQRPRPLGQRAAWRDAPDEGALARLAHAKVAGVQHAEAHLQHKLSSDAWPPSSSTAVHHPCCAADEKLLRPA